MKLTFIRTAVLSAALLPFVGVPTPCAAQDANRDTIMTPTDVGSVVDRVERQSRSFKEEFDRAVSHSLMDGTRLEDKAKQRADDLHDSAAKLGNVFHDKKDKNNPAVRDQVDRTLSAAADLNHVMVEHRFTDKLHDDWDVLRAELNGLAGMYQLTPLPGK
ncbi:MAG TPA: hypothetical protein VHW09_22545 [Bryobacteraceae bacterium]|jgi:hypothetical protein|nr:hypothetical protein [Bryobacteraceae bacterium]